MLGSIFINVIEESCVGEKMNLSEIEFKTEYRSFVDNIPKDFYEPALKNAILYQRAVGFFSSSSLSSIADGIDGLVNNGGNIQLVASPKLSAEDIQAIQEGYEERKIIERALSREINTDDQENRNKLSFLSRLIAEGYLDIKIAFLTTDNEIAMYHEKMGIISDDKHNTIAFSGSMNESENAFRGNYEAFDVFCSWTKDSERVFQKQLAFKAIWEDYEPGVKTIEFPEVVKDKLLKAYAPTYRQNRHMLADETDIAFLKSDDRKAIYLPEDFEIRQYQENAIKGWKNNNYCGIYDMATGTGKTLTALASVEQLFRDNSERLAVIIICPYQHLVEQWVEDIVRFGMNPIIGYSTSPQKHWKKNLQQAVRSFQMKVSNHFCLVTTVDSMKTKAVYEQISMLSKDAVFIVDEAHNVGAVSTRRYLPEQIPFRLGLSATIDRHNDEEGTEALKKYFGKTCITYSLRDAIDNGMLTPYYYHPVIVYLTEDELEEYLDITAVIVRNMSSKKKNRKLSENVKQLLIKRSRIVAGARNKIDILKKEILPYKDDNYILVYCGATKVNVSEMESDVRLELDQINIVADLLGNQLNMKVGRFTSLESADERVQIRKMFGEGKQLQALVAIKCLDEGVNIPSIKTAFILASSTNPKEYIQRRGRVLRKFPGKTRAEIYDFITLPFSADKIGMIKPKIVSGSKGLVRRELIRMMDFAEIADNPSETNKLILELKHDFQISDKELLNEGGIGDVIG